MSLLRTLLFGLCLLSAPVRGEAQQLWMLDFVYLNSGKTLADRDAYNRVAEPIAAKHGAQLQVTLDRLDEQVGPVPDGPMQPERLDMWTMKTGDTLRRWGEDPDFQAIIPRILKVHDMSRLTIYQGREYSMATFIDGGVYLVDLMRFHPDRFDAQRFNFHVNDFSRAVGRHDARFVASLGNVTRMSGGGAEANWLNIYRFPTVQAIRDAMADPKVLKHEDTREDILDIASSSRAVYIATHLRR